MSSASTMFKITHKFTSYGSKWYGAADMGALLVAVNQGVLPVGYPTREAAQARIPDLVAVANELYAETIRAEARAAGREIDNWHRLTIATDDFYRVEEVPGEAPAWEPPATTYERRCAELATDIPEAAAVLDTYLAGSVTCPRCKRRDGPISSELCAECQADLESERLHPEVPFPETHETPETPATPDYHEELRDGELRVASTDAKGGA